MNIVYRLPVATDVIGLIAISEEWCEDQNIPYDMEGIMNYINLQLGRVPGFVAIDTDNKNKLVGVLSYATSYHPFNSKVIIGRKIISMVSKDYRDKGIGRTLLEMVEKEAKSKGATKFYFTSNQQPSSEYTVHETDYVKEI